MGRAEDRKKRKHIKSKLTDEQFKNMMNSVNREYIRDEVERQCTWYKKVFTECIIESFEKNKIGKNKAMKIIEDVDLIIKRRMSNGE